MIPLRPQQHQIIIGEMFGIWNELFVEIVGWLGKLSPYKTDEFSEKFKKRGGVIFNQIFAIIDDTSVMNFRKQLQHNFPKIHPFWKGKASLTINHWLESLDLWEGDLVKTHTT